MKIFVFGDVHGHGVGMSVIEQAIASEAPDLIVCLGDVATIGPEPQAVVAALRQLDAQFIMGNHDLSTLDPEVAGAMAIAPPLHPSIHWTKSVLSKGQLDFIGSFQDSIQVAVSSKQSVHFFHGTPGSVIGAMLPMSNDEDLDDILGASEANILVGGHTHFQMLHRYKGRLLVNPGSVGQGFWRPAGPGYPKLLPWVEYVVLTFQGDETDISLRHAEFDREPFYDTVHESGLPDLVKNWWLEQYQ